MDEGFREILARIEDQAQAELLEQAFMAMREEQAELERLLADKQRVKDSTKRKKSEGPVFELSVLDRERKYHSPVRFVEGFEPRPCKCGCGLLLGFRAVRWWSLEQPMTREEREWEDTKALRAASVELEKLVQHGARIVKLARTRINGQGQMEHPVPIYEYRHGREFNFSEFAPKRRDSR